MKHERPKLCKLTARSIQLAIFWSEIRSFLSTFWYALVMIATLPKSKVKKKKTQRRNTFHLVKAE